MSVQEFFSFISWLSPEQSELQNYTAGADSKTSKRNPIFSGQRTKKRGPGELKRAVGMGKLFSFLFFFFFFLPFFSLGSAIKLTHFSEAPKIPRENYLYGQRNWGKRPWRVRLCQGNPREKWVWEGHPPSLCRNLHKPHAHPELWMHGTDPVKNRKSWKTEPR